LLRERPATTGRNRFSLYFLASCADTLGDAILDCIVHNAYRLELDDPSMRKIKASEETVSTSSPVATTAADSKPITGARK
jgi:hypothetical protein